MEDFINWLIENKDVLIPALFAIINGVITFITTRKSRIKKISNEETVDKLTLEVKKRLLQGGTNEKTKDK